MRLFDAENGVYYLHDNKNIKLDWLYLEKEYKRNYLIQECLNQSESISQFNPTSVNTIRLTLYRSVKDDRCHIVSGCMRIGGKGSVVDNAHAGGAIIGIYEDGTLGKYLTNQYGQKFDMFNGIDFSNNTFKIPNYTEIIDWACKIGKYVPHHRLLALDVAIKQDGTPVLIEFNVNAYGLWAFQYTIGPCFGKFTDEIIDYCRLHKNENQLVLKL